MPDMTDAPATPQPLCNCPRDYVDGYGTLGKHNLYCQSVAGAPAQMSDAIDINDLRHSADEWGSIGRMTAHDLLDEIERCRAENERLREVALAAAQYLADVNADFRTWGSGVKLEEALARLGAAPAEARE